MSDYIIQTKSLHKSYKNGVTALKVLKGIDLSVRKNEFLAIEGPSGAGKSTLLHILGGLDYPSQGSVFFEGANIYHLTENERAEFRSKKVGFVFQFYHLLSGFSALENVLMPCLLNSWWQRKKAAHYAKTLLERLGLSHRMHQRPNQLSGGEQQRLAIARALINRPEILLCDEPTGNLDSENGRNILNLLKELNQKENVTIILVSHNKDITANAQKVIYLKDGLILH